MTFQERAKQIIDLSHFYVNRHHGVNPLPLPLEEVDLSLPKEEQYVLRCCVKIPSTDFRIPHFLTWVQPMLDLTLKNQKENLDLRQPYCYITVRNGLVKSHTDDEWHVDGFSMRYSHIPEQNYVWCSNDATEVLRASFDFPSNFDPLIHNINWFFEDNIPKNHEIIKIWSKEIYLFDPYVIHRRPPNTFGKQRTFVRITFSPLEINDVNNTVNPFLPVNYTRDGVKDFRDKLIRYGKV